MADRLTQLQDAIDNQLTLMYASINYINSRHPYSDIDGQPSLAPAPAPAPITALTTTTAPLTNGNGNTAQPQANGPVQLAASAAAPAEQQNPAQPASPPPPEQADTFDAALHELARDLVLQEQQIELLIASLPGLGNSEASQGRRMRELEAELREVELERSRAEVERDRMVDALGSVLVGMRRVP